MNPGNLLEQFLGRGAAGPLADAARAATDRFLPGGLNPPGGFAGAATQANRPLFDNVADYNGFTTVGILPSQAVPPFRLRALRQKGRRWTQPKLRGE